MVLTQTIQSQSPHRHVLSANTASRKVRLPNFAKISTPEKVEDPIMCLQLFSKRQRRQWLLYTISSKTTSALANTRRNGKMGIVTPIFKKGSKSKVNYRPVTLLDIAGKIHEMYIHSTI